MSLIKMRFPNQSLTSLLLYPWPTCLTSIRPLILLLISNAYSRNQPRSPYFPPSSLRLKFQDSVKYFWL